ncbi:MAG: hypothetical protein MUF54_02885, partial [Polyangiaceae bacterium]|nr:hypothetical protein [Polyangiaceae bacterium]
MRAKRVLDEGSRSPYSAAAMRMTEPEGMTARVALVLLAGCSGSSTVPPSNPELEQLVAKEAEVEAEREGGPACVARVQWAGEPMRDLQQMGRACGVGERMHALTASREGSQAEGEA